MQSIAGPDIEEPDGATDSERELVRRAAAGDEAAFAVLYRRHRPAIARFIRARMDNPDDAHDVEQEVFLLAHRALPRFEWREIGVGAWLFAIARRRVAQYWRARGRRPQVALGEHHVATIDGPEQAYEREDECRTTLAAVAMLPEPQRRAVRLRMLGFSHREIARAMGRTEANVRVLHHRALIRLRGHLLASAAA